MRTHHLFTIATVAASSVACGALSVALALAIPATARAEAGTDASTGPFPPEAVALDAAALQARLVGPTWGGQMRTGAHIEMVFKDNGTVFYQARSGPYPISDQGKWRVAGSQLCVEWRKSPNWCSETRQGAGGALMLLRESDGSVLVMEPR